MQVASVASIQALVLLLASCVTSGKLLHLSVLPFSHVQNGDHGRACLIAW